MSADPVLLEFDMLGRPLLTNAYMKLGPHARYKQRLPWRTTAHTLAMLRRVGSFDRIDVTAQARYKTRQLCDTDAPAPALKAVLDGLVDAGVVEDDGPAFVASVRYLAPYTDRTKPDALLVTVVEAS